MGSAVGKHSLFDSLPSLNQIHIVILGLDASGKTTALYRLKFDQYLNTVPTIGFNCEKIKANIGKNKTITFKCWDIGGQDKLRPLWKAYTRCTDGIVFVVDSVDQERMEEAKVELQKTVRLKENQGIPILVLANKQDLPAAKDPKEIAAILGLPDLNTTNLWHVQPTCAIIGDGLMEGIEILYDMIIKKKKLAKQTKRKR